MFVIKTHSMGSRIMLRGCGIGFDDPLVWTTSKSNALQLGYDECESVIRFIIEVVNYELEDDLYIVEV